MIVVDTSVWIVAFRSAGRREARVLTNLLDHDDVGLPVVVRLELIGGASRADRPGLRRLLSALPLLDPTDDTWQIMDGWVERAAEAGTRFGIGDLLIGALAAECGALVWSLDSVFARMESLDLIARYDPS